MTGTVSGTRTWPADPDSDAKLRFWRSLPIFRDLPDAVSAELSAISRRKRWAAGATLFRRGDDSSYMIAVEAGRIRLSLQASSGREFALRHVGTGSLFGEIGILDGSTRSADATTLVATSGYVIDRQQFLSLMNGHPPLAQAVVRHLCSLLRYTTEHIETIALYGLEGRISRFLLSQLSGSDSDDGTNRARLELDVSQTDIAELLGASRPKVNRAIAALEAAGAISRQHKSIICNRARLSQLADPEEDR